MKKIKFLFMSMCVIASMGLTACSDDDDNQNNGNGGSEQPVGGHHFDLWVALDQHGGMGRDVQTLVRSLPSLDNPGDIISF